MRARAAASPRPARAAAAGEQLRNAAAGRRGALLLSAGTIGSGLLAYAFNAVAARALGADAYGPIALLWAGMFLVAVVLFRPLEQTLSRAIAERRAQEVDSRGALRSVARIGVGTAALAAIACLALWEPITDRLFDGNGALTVALAAGIVGYAASYLMRGVLGGVRWFGGYGTLLLADGSVRLALALPLVVVASQDLAAAAVALAAFAGAAAPLVAPHWRERVRLRAARTSPFDVGEAGRFALPVGVVAAADQVLLSGGPLLVALTAPGNATRAAGIVFAATMLVRAPAYLFQGVAAALMPSLTTLEVLEDRGRFRRALGRTLVALGAFSALLVVGVAAVGPHAMGLLYGTGFSAGRADLIVLALGVGLYLTGATLYQAALARRRQVASAVSWALAAAVFVVVELALPGGSLHRVAVAFALGALVLAAGFLLVVTPPRPVRAVARRIAGSRAALAGSIEGDPAR